MSGLVIITTLTLNLLWRLTIRIEKTPTSHRSRQTKKPYTKRKLVNYGDVRAVTKNLGGVLGMNDVVSKRTRASDGWIVLEKDISVILYLH